LTLYSDVDRVAAGPAATISFDHVELFRPVFHGDLIRLEAEIINMNRSSIAIQVCITLFHPLNLVY
jgi:acyl-CoA hydrolase